MISPHWGQVGSAPRLLIWNWHATHPTIALTRWPGVVAGQPEPALRLLGALGRGDAAPAGAGLAGAAAPGPPPPRGPGPHPSGVASVLIERSSRLDLCAAMLRAVAYRRRVHAQPSAPVFP